MPDPDMDPTTSDVESSAATVGYRPLDGSVDLTPPLGSATVPPSGAANGSGVTFHPLTDPALDQHYAGLANQYDPDPQSGVLGTFQQLPPDGIADRWRYTPPNIPGEPMRDDGGNACPAWLVSRRIGRTGDLADHNFIIVADQLGGPIKARFSYGPSQDFLGQLVSATGSGNDTDTDDLAAWAKAGQPFVGVRVQQIPATDAAVIKAGQTLDQNLGTMQNPGQVPYGLLPEQIPWDVNSNSAAANIVNNAIQQSHPGAGPMLPYPGSWPFGWNTPADRR